MGRSLRVWAVALFFATLAGCATNQHVTGNRFTLPETIAAEQGVILVKLIGVQPLSAFNVKWRTLTVKNKEGRAFDIQDTAPGSASYSLFLGTLPAGQYQISRFESVAQAPGWLLALMMSDSQNVTSQFGTFTIQGGATTNLGTIVFAIPKDEKGLLKTVVLADEAGLASALTDVDSISRPKLDNRPSLGWDKASDASSSADALAMVRKFASSLFSIQRTPNGKIIAGGALGLIHQRGADGQWKSRSVGALDTITYVQELEDGRIFAGTDNGRYYLWQPAQQAWQRHNLPDRDTEITRLEAAGPAGYVIQVAILGPANPLGLRKYSFFLKQNLEEDGAEKVLLTFDEGSAIGRAPIFFDGENILVYFNHVGFSRRADLYRIDPRAQTKRMEQVDYWVSDIYRLPDGTVILDRVNGLSNFTSSSKDNGRTWTHGSVSGPNNTRFVNTNLGYGLGTSSMGWSTITVALNRTDDGGKSWTSVGAPLEAMGKLRVIPLREDELVIYTGLKIVSTRDQGKTWRTEWAVE